MHSGERSIARGTILAVLVSSAAALGLAGCSQSHRAPLSGAGGMGGAGATAGDRGSEGAAGVTADGGDASANPRERCQSDGLEIR